MAVPPQRVPDLSINSPFAFLADLKAGVRPYDPPVCYKHTKRSHAESLVAHGLVRLGTLSDYRMKERHGHGILDAKEGRQRLIKYDPDVLYEHPVEMDGFEVCDGALIDPGTNRIMSANEFRDSGADSYVLCLCESSEPAVGRRMSGGEYDTVVEIVDVVSFFACIADDLIARGVTRAPYLGKCVYDGSTVWINPLDSRRNKLIPRTLAKDVAFDYQREVRLVFPMLATSNRAVPPLDFAVQACRKHVRIL